MEDRERHEDVEKNYEWLIPGSVVLAKAKDHPPWPAIVGADKKKWYEYDHENDKMAKIHVFFLGEYTDDWVNLKDVHKYNSRNAQTIYDTSKTILDGTELRNLQVALFEAKNRIDFGETGYGVITMDKNVELNVGSLVVAELDVFPPWPAVVKRPGDADGDKMFEDWKRGGRVYCSFLGNYEEDDEECSWITLENVKSCTMEKLAEIKEHRLHHLSSQYEDWIIAMEQAVRILNGVTPPPIHATENRSTSVSDKDSDNPSTSNDSWDNSVDQAMEDVGNMEGSHIMKDNETSEDTDAGNSSMRSSKPSSPG